ncbi:hypothetical protein IQ06DRAFT_31843 [Phaeosphaeriaceae sp. SRC1lsM3a]|nr:hypothetical protein IQ06DRAFT_31843 [Stagonospora sp. SRC1lsM3a]
MPAHGPPTASPSTPCLNAIRAIVTAVLSRIGTAAASPLHSSVIVATEVVAHGHVEMFSNFTTLSSWPSQVHYMTSTLYSDIRTFFIETFVQRTMHAAFFT